MHVISARGAGGAESFLSSLVHEGDKREWEQLVINPFVDDSAPQLARLFQPVTYRARPCGNLFAVPAVRRWVAEEIASFRPDVVHVLLFKALITVATLRRRPGERWLLTNVYGDALRQTSHGRLKEPFDRWAARRFDQVVAISEAVRTFLVSEQGYPPAKVRAIPLGWKGRPLPSERDGKAPTIVCVAHLRPEKGHSVLLDAFALVRKEVPEARLILVGQGTPPEELVAQMTALGVTEAIEITGRVKDVWPYLARAHVFALSSLSEAFGIAILEAMAAALPVVATDAGGIPELVVPGVTGELFPPRDHEALARHLIRILTSPELQARMGAAARAAAEPLSMSNTVPRYFDVCEELLRGPSPGFTP